MKIKELHPRLDAKMLFGKAGFQAPPQSGDKAAFAYNFQYSSVTTSSTVDSTVPEVWAQMLEDYLEGRKFLAQWAVEVSELQSKPGDKIHIHKKTELSATGDLTETTQLVGNEEQMSFNTVYYEPAERGNAVAWTVQGNSKSIYNLREIAKELLGRWAAKKIDGDLFTSTALVSKRLYGGSKATAALVTSSDKLTPTMITKAKWYLASQDVPGWSSMDPDDPNPEARGYYIAVVSPQQLYDFVNHSDYTDAAKVVAIESAKASDRFRGFQAWWDNVLIYDTTQVSYSTPGGYLAAISRGIMFGQRFMGRATGIYEEGPDFIWYEEVFDYGRTLGVSVRWYDECKLLNSDRGCGLITAATDLSAIT